MGAAAALRANTILGLKFGALEIPVTSWVLLGQV